MSIRVIGQIVAAALWAEGWSTARLSERIARAPWKHRGRRGNLFAADEVAAGFAAADDAEAVACDQNFSSARA
jgi:hypothetical protein